MGLQSTQPLTPDALIIIIIIMGLKSGSVSEDVIGDLDRMLS